MKPIVFFFLPAVLLGVTCNGSQEHSGKPNIIIIYADDLGYGDLSTYGGDIPSPNIQRIADAGIKFTDFYAAGPVCTVSRYGLLTGNYPQRSLHGLTSALMPEQTGHLDKTEKIMPAYLKDVGYRTALFGKWHLGNNQPEYFPSFYGFDEFIGHTHGCIDFFSHVYGSLGNDWYRGSEPLYEDGYATDLITNHAIEYLSGRDDAPFFVFMAYNAPHYGKSDPSNLPGNTLVLQEGTRQGVSYANTLQAPAAYLDRFAHVTDAYRRYYSAMVSSLDDNIGRLLDFLEASGQLENTVIWFISDNGGYSETLFQHASNGTLKGQKGQLDEGGIRVPALVCWKGKIKPGQVISQPYANMDLLPTLLNIVGADRKEISLDGISLAPVLLNDEKLERDIFWKYHDQKAFRRGNWKMKNNELYDLSRDISEQTDLSGTNATVFEELRTAWNETAEKMEKITNR